MNILSRFCPHSIPMFFTLLILPLLISATAIQMTAKEIDHSDFERYQYYLKMIDDNVQFSLEEKQEFKELQIQFDADHGSTGSLDNEGGPDNHFYSYRDNVAPDDVPYEWIELRDDPEATWIGGYNDFTRIDDGYSRQKIAIGFPFPFYDEVYDSIRVTSNGVILFNITDQSWENGCVPFAPVPGPMIALFWDDIGLVVENRPEDTLCVGYKNFGDYFVLEYDDATRFEPLCRDTALSFQAIFYPTGDIKMQYKSITPQHFTCANSQSIGIQRSGELGATALSYVCNREGIQPHNGLAILFSRASGIPAKLNDLSAVSTDAGVELTWSDPQVDTRGEAVSIDNVEIWLGPIEGGNLIATVDPGTESFLHTSPPQGYVTYSVRAFADPYYADSCNVSLTVGSFSVFQDFETDNGNWIATPSTGGWEWGVPNYPIGPTAYSGDKLWGTLLEAAYPNDACWTLDFAPELAVMENNAYVEFQSWCFTETGHDGCNFKISIDGGETWSIIFPDSGDYDVMAMGAENLCLGGQAGWSVYNLTRVWKFMRFQIGEYLGETPMFRFEFGSDDFSLGVGFYFDDFRIWGLGIPGNESDNNADLAVPGQYKLQQNFPNPFNNETSLRFEIPEEGLVNISIYNLMGQKVAQPVSEVFSPGSHHVLFDAGTLSTGVYFVHMETRNFKAINKMLLLK